MPNTPTKIQPSKMCNEGVSEPLNNSNLLEQLNISEAPNKELQRSIKADPHLDTSTRSAKEDTSVLFKKKDFPYSSESDSDTSNTSIEIGSSEVFNKSKIVGIKIKASAFFKKEEQSQSQKADSDSELSDSSTKIDSPESHMCDALLQRQKNIKERDAFLASFLQDPEFAEAVENIGLFQEGVKQLSSSKSKAKKRYTDYDTSFHFTGNIPKEKRKSLRLQDKEPIFNYSDLMICETDFGQRSKRKRSNSSDSDYDYSDLEKIIYQPRAGRNNGTVKRTYFLHVEDVTEQMIKNIAWRVSDKTYSKAGSSCHQCRQKTLDTKTFCRDEKCTGVKGQFCGVCLDNRYGENIATVLKDPNWRCPVCRGVCNCSFCRSKAGKRPTGILVPMAHRTGHRSVKDFLDSLRGEGDYADMAKDPKRLLGFSQDLNFAHMGGDAKHFIGSPTDLVQFRTVLDTFAQELNCK